VERVQPNPCLTTKILKKESQGLPLQQPKIDLVLNLLRENNNQSALLKPMPILANKFMRQNLKNISLTKHLKENKIRRRPIESLRTLISTLKVWNPLPR
jgi:hypothetical protein